MTPEAKRRKNQKKKQKQKQKKQAEKVANEEAVVEQSHDDSVESADVLSQSPDESDMNTSTTTAPLEDQKDDPDSKGRRGSAENLEIIRSLQLDSGTSIDGQLERRLSHEVTIIDDIPKSESEDNDAKVVEADHNVALPQSSAESEIDLVQSPDTRQNSQPSVLHTACSTQTAQDIEESSSHSVSSEPDTTNQETAIITVETQTSENHVAEEPDGQFQAETSENISPLLEKDGEVAAEKAHQKGPTISQTFEALVDQHFQIANNDESSPAGVASEAGNVSAAPALNVEPNRVQMKDLFAGNEIQSGEAMPWETQLNDEGVGNNLSYEDKQINELFTLQDNSRHELMPWETSNVLEADDSKPEDINKTVDIAPEGSTEQDAKHFDETALDKSNEEPFAIENKTVEGNKNSGEIAESATPPDKLFAPVFEDESEEAVYNAHTSFPEHGDGHSGETEEGTSSPQNGKVGITSELIPDSNQNRNVSEREKDLDKLAAIFSDDDGEENTSWLKQDPQRDSVPAKGQTLSSEETPMAQEQSQPAMKFSFLQEDDDLLDEELSEEDEFLPSDDDQLSNQAPDVVADAASNVGTAENFDAISKTYKPVIPSSFARPTGHASKYEPAQPSKVEDSAFLATGRSEPAQYGIATPQFALQQNLPTQQLNVKRNQEAVEKINLEKKKSDAYDFPLDLFPKKNSIAHAKPVRVPNFTPGSSQLASGTPNPAFLGHNGVQRSVSNSRSTSDAPLPKNPYASLVTPQSKVQGSIPMPTQGTVPPNVILPSIPQTGPVQNAPQFMNPQYPAPNSYLANARSRGYSNASIGGLSSQGIEQSTVNANAPQYPPTSRKTSATKYAPVSPAQGSYPAAGKALTDSATNMPPFRSLPSATTHANQNAKTMPPMLNVPVTSPPSNILSPTSASSTRRFHARSNSSVYTPNQSEYTAKYAPTVHPQYQNTIAVPQQNVSNVNVPYATVRKARPGSLTGVTAPKIIDEPVDNQALLHRQFPLFHWSSSDKIVYAVPVEPTSNSYVMGPGSSLQCLQIASVESKIPSSKLLESFPGPLIKNKVKKKDLEKWVENSLTDYAESSLEYTMLAVLRSKLMETTDWKEISRCLYNPDELLTYLSQPMIDSKPIPVTTKMDTGAQLKVLAYLQTGGHDKALALAMEMGDYAMALLIGSLMGKDKWAEIIQIYLSNEFHVDSDASHFSINLLSLVFQVFIGNSKTAIEEFYSLSAKGQWAAENWRVIVAAVLSNIDAGCSTSSSKEVPPVISEFLVEYGIFLSQRGLNAEACIVFSIANLPLSSSPVAKTSVKFEQIGSPMSLEGCIFSEIYEFVNCPDAKGYPSLFTAKLYHSFYLQEHGLCSAASRYADHLTGMLKHFPKKDPLALNVAHGLNELSTRLAGSSSGWLGKPKLSSVWGQLDKSFNKYIGGDDDSLIKKPQGTKVFDGFTPVTSRNSSMLDVSQFQYTPVHKQVHNLGYNADQNMALPPVSANPLDASVQNQSKSLLSKTISEQGPPPIMSPYSVNSSPRQPEYQGLHSSYNPKQLQLRRVKTEQTAEAISGERQSLTTTSLQPAQDENYPAGSSAVFHPSDALAPSVPISRTSPHYSSTPDLLQNKSQAPPNSFISSDQKTLSDGGRHIDPPRPLYTSSVSEAKQAKSLYLPSAEGVAPQNYRPPPSNGEVTYKQENHSQVSITGFEKMVEGTYGLQNIKSSEVHVEHANSAPIYDLNENRSGGESDSISDKASTSVLHNDIYNGPPGDVVPETSELKSDSSTSALASNCEPRIQAPGSKDREARETPDYQEAVADRFIANQLADATSNVQEAVEENGSEVVEDANRLSAKAPLSLDLGMKTPAPRIVNPYAPSFAEKQHELKLQKDGSSSSATIKTSTYVLEEQTNNDDSQNQTQGQSNDYGTPAASPSFEGSTSALPVNRFDPIKPPDALTAEIFEPVIKKSSASRAFTPLVVQSPEDQYDDIVEDESDEEDEEEQKCQLEKLQQEKRRKEEEERKKKEQEKAEAKKAKRKDDDKANGWFGWLKKDPNEKKPIKAKLGHKSTFYYDEKLKRWVNKDASEEEKEKIASPPPPPPVVKRMDNGPKTKPLPSPEAQIKGTVGAILPKNPITGVPLGSPTPAAIGNGDTSAMPPIQMSHPGVNLSGKKANGLDDLLSLTGSNGTASRRKRKPGRGYVNVMDTK